MLALPTPRKRNSITDTVDNTPTQTDTSTLMRFLTLGGATVDVRATRFTTRWAGGPPYAAAEPYEINGFQWKCTGCGAYGREGDTYKDPNYREEREAREAANTHAETCRAMPKPTA